MTTIQLTYLSAVDLAQRIRARELSSKEVVRAHLERLSTLDLNTAAADKDML